MFDNAQFLFFAYMKTKINTLLFALFLFSSLNSKAQTQFSGWLATFNSFKTGKQTSIHADVQFRSNDQIRNLQTLLIRSGLNYNLNKKVTLTAGYAFISNRRVITDVAGYAPEHRIWEQLLYNHKLKSIAISHRLRIEQRFIRKSVVQNDELETDGYSYANRFRYFLRGVIPLQKKQSFNRGFFGALQNEVFINFGNTSAVNDELFDQNRFYIAAGYRLSSKSDLEIGYMNQYVNGRGSQFTNNHILQLATYFRL